MSWHKTVFRATADIAVYKEAGMTDQSPTMACGTKTSIISYTVLHRGSCSRLEDQLTR
jgi:hypothetical protein